MGGGAAPTITRLEDLYDLAMNAVADWNGSSGTDDTARAQAAINACPAGGVCFLPPRALKLSDYLTIDKSMTLMGLGVNPYYDSLNTTFSFDLPAGLVGSVLVQTAAAKDVIRITKAGASVHLRNFGIRFDGAHRFNNTGHGVSVVPSTTYSSGSDHGTINFDWENVAVFGHDGNHYAVRLINPLLGTITGLRSWGGGVAQVICDSYAGNYGNLVFVHPYGLLGCGGSAHGYSLQPRTSGAGTGVLNLLTFIRPQANSGQIAGRGADVTNAQYLFRADNPFSASNLALISPDFECGAGLANPIRFGGGDVFIDPSGIMGAPSDLTSKAYTIFRSEFGAKRLNSDMTVSNTNTPGPSIALGTGAGTGATISGQSGDDEAGRFTINTGTAPAAAGAVVATFTWGRLTGASYVALEPLGGTWSEALGLFVASITGTGFVIKATNTLAPSGAYDFQYLVRP